MTPQPLAFPKTIERNRLQPRPAVVSVFFYLQLSHGAGSIIVIFKSVRTFSTLSSLAHLDVFWIQLSNMASNPKIQDAEVLGDKANASHEERMHWGALTEEELVVEEKLRLRVDCLIMPMVILVYLMNYIDR